MKMKGFDPGFRDFEHYIYAITAQIWEGRQLDAIRRYYATDAPVRAPTGLVVGSKAVIASSATTMADFPDRRLLGEDVVWCGDDERGYLSSHRILSTGTYAGNGSFGCAASRPVRYRVIADCWCKENKVVEEWLVRDQGAIARGLGLSPRTLAARQIATGDAAWYTPDLEKKPSAYKPVLAEDEDAQSYMQLWLGIWQEQKLAAIPAAYHHAAILHGPQRSEWIGHAGVDRFQLSYLTAMRDPTLAIQDLTAIENRHGKTVAMRWTIDGASSGRGAFADIDAGQQMHVMGISQARYAGGRIEAEWVLVDEVAIWKQLLKKKAD